MMLCEDDYLALNKRRLQDLRSKKKTKEQLLGMVVEGLPDGQTQSVIDDLIVKRKKKLKDLKEINSGVPMDEIKAQRNEQRLIDLRAEVMEQMMDEGVSLDDMTLDMVDERMAKLQDKQPQTSESKKIFAYRLVCAGIQCILDSTNTFIPILICYTHGHNKTIFHHWGTSCVDLFIQTLVQWAEEQKSKDGGAPELQIFFHNLKGFDGVFLVNSLYKQNLKVTDIMGTGTKMLHFKHKNLIFKDSQSFLNVPLTNFTKTFGLTELKKGWFPHKFSKKFKSTKVRFQTFITMNPSIWMRRRKKLVKIGMQSK